MLRLLSLLLALVLGGCGVMAAGCEEDAGPRVQIVLENACESPIYSVSHTLLMEGRVFSSGGQCLANEDPYPVGEKIDILLDRMDLANEEADAPEAPKGLAVEISVEDGEGRSYPCAPTLTLDAQWGMAYNYTLSGSAEEGFTLTPGFRDASVTELITKRTGIDVSALVVTASGDTHGGFHGDGETLVSMPCDAPAFEALGGTWRELPLPETLPLGELGMDLASLRRGHWRFLDRHEEAQDPTDDRAAAERASSNYSLMAYDAERETLWYYELDT